MDRALCIDLLGEVRASEENEATVGVVVAAVTTVAAAVVAPDGTVVVLDATVGGGATPRIASMERYVGAAPVPYRQPSTSPSRTTCRKRWRTPHPSEGITGSATG